MISPGQKFDTTIRLEIVRNGRKEEVALRDLLLRPTIVSVYRHEDHAAQLREVLESPALRPTS